jgi:glycosyltransferase involved in cell wall biosynthesis
VIPEAYSAGVPVIAFPAGGIPEVLDDERTGFLTRASTAEALAERILYVLRLDRTALRAVVKRARKEWDTRFSLSAYRNSVCGVLAQAMKPVFHGYEELSRSAGVLTD